jgi:hypothetical protein
VKGNRWVGSVLPAVAIKPSLLERFVEF